jgi:hypothetical protein
VQSPAPSGVFDKNTRSLYSHRHPITVLSKGGFMRILFLNTGNSTHKGGAMDGKQGKHHLAGLVSVAAVLFVSQLACLTTTDRVSEESRQTQAEIRKAAAETAAANYLAPGKGGGGLACFGTKDQGVACLTDTGWETFAYDEASLGFSKINDLTACPDQKIYAATDTGIAAFDGKGWEVIPIDGYYWAEFVACGADGGVWAGFFEGAGRYADGRWTTFPSKLYSTGRASGVLYGMEVAPDGTVWVANADTVSRYDGESWKEYKFSGPIDFVDLVVDSKNRVWTLGPFDPIIHLFENGKWKLVDPWKFMVANALAVDPLDRLWVMKFLDGVEIYDGAAWTTLSFPEDGIHSNIVNEAVFDGAGRTWLGMMYGVDVFDGQVWNHYRMDNAGLPDNEIANLAVAGNGPVLPAALAKAYGSISGRVLLGVDPVADAEMEICVEDIWDTEPGASPCSRQPYRKQIRTDAEGRFLAEEMPEGFYVLTIKIQGHWIQLKTLQFERIQVREGRETDTGDLAAEV